MAEEKLKEKEMKGNEIIWENKKYVLKYGLTRKELETVVQDDLKFSNSFWVIANYLQWARSLIEERKVKECKHFIERAKYLLKGCKDGP